MFATIVYHHLNAQNFTFQKMSGISFWSKTLRMCNKCPADF